MKPEYIGIGNFDEDNYVYAYCQCPLSMDYAIKWTRIKDGKQHKYTCTCEDCGTEVGVISKSYSPELLTESEEKESMNKKLANLTVNKSADYYDKVVKALEDAGFLLVLELETTSDKYYIVAESEEK